MFNVLGWFAVGMLIWLCCTLMSMLHTKLAPETGELNNNDGKHKSRRGLRAENQKLRGALATKENEVADLRKRVETLEAIVTDSKFQWEQEFKK